MQYDLEDRTKKFSHSVIDLLRQMPINELNKSVVSQLIRSATSVGANYCEANNASSRKDFSNKIYICRKEAQETKYWLELLAKASPEFIVQLRLL